MFKHIISPVILPYFWLFVQIPKLIIQVPHHISFEQQVHMDSVFAAKRIINVESILRDVYRHAIIPSHRPSKLLPIWPTDFNLEQVIWGKLFIM